MKSYPVLAYHKISQQWELSFTMMYPKAFRAQMHYLAGMGYKACNLKEYLEKPADNKFVLTFDDAYESVYCYAAPILKKLDFRATLFVPNAYIGKDNDWDFTPGNIRSRHMNGEQLRELHRKGWEIASHGEGHRVLTGMKNGELQYELEHSKASLEALTGEEVHTFCFPFGVYNKRVVDAARAAGYKNLIGFTGASRHGVIPRSVVYRLVDNPRTVLRKIRIHSFWHRFESCKEQLFHSFACFTRIKQKFMR